MFSPNTATVIWGLLASTADTHLPSWMKLLARSPTPVIQLCSFLNRSNYWIEEGGGNPRIHILLHPICCLFPQLGGTPQGNSLSSLSHSHSTKSVNHHSAGVELVLLWKGRRLKGREALQLMTKMISMLMINMIMRLIISQSLMPHFHLRAKTPRKRELDFSKQYPRTCLGCV